jgi:hypothetical protein
MSLAALVIWKETKSWMLGDPGVSAGVRTLCASLTTPPAVRDGATVAVENSERSFLTWFPAHQPISRMYPGAQFLFLCNPAKQSIELKPFFLTKSRANGVVVFPRDSPNLFGCVSARGRQM